MANEFEGKTDFPQARELANKAESCQSLSGELNVMPFEQRLQLAKQVVQLAADDHAQNPNVPVLELDSATDSGGKQHLTDMRCKTQNGPVDIYNLPGKIDELNFPLDVKLRQDRAHSQHLDTGGLEIYPVNKRF